MNAPVLIASDAFKNSLLEAESIKFKLESKDEEIKEIKRNHKIKVIEKYFCFFSLFCSLRSENIRFEAKVETKFRF